MNSEKSCYINDLGLLNELKNSDHSAFTVIYNRYWSHLYIYAYNILLNKDTCEDIVQEIFTDLWNRRKENYIENLSAYLYKAAKFQILKQIRKNKISAEYMEHYELVLTEKSLEEMAELNDINEKIYSLVEQLPEKRKKILIMSRFKGLSNKEIAEILNISLQTVKNQISKALNYLRSSKDRIL